MEINPLLQLLSKLDTRQMIFYCVFIVLVIAGFIVFIFSWLNSKGLEEVLPRKLTEYKDESGCLGCSIIILMICILIAIGSEWSIGNN